MPKVQSVGEAAATVARSWAAENPQYFACPENAAQIQMWLARNHLEFDYENMTKAFTALTEMGKLKQDLVPIYNEFGRVFGHDLRSNSDKYQDWQLDPEANPQPRVSGGFAGAPLAVPKGTSKQIQGYRPTKREYSSWSAAQLQYFHQMNPAWDSRAADAYKG